MPTSQSLTYKVAKEEWEFEQIHKLNYKTFVEEIPQNKRNSKKAFVDKFHKENTYLICLQNDILVGMIAIRNKRPFSLDEKIDDLNSYLPDAHSACEIRLLAVEKEYRSGKIFFELLKKMAEHCISQGFDLAIISGALRQKKLYQHIGFIPFGPLVGSPEAPYQPLYLTPEAFLEKAKNFIRNNPTSSIKNSPANFLPGPVTIHQNVKQVFNEIPISHRCENFMKEFKRTKRHLCEWVGSRSVEIFMGSGTLANDVIAGQLSLKNTQGLILSNGEFGDRLIDHATRFGLSFDILQVNWGTSFRSDLILNKLEGMSNVKWLWVVHCETSTGVLNDLDMFKTLCREKKIHLCLDSISSIGTVPVDLREVYLSSGVSGKGLGSFPGLSMVFYNHKVRSAPYLPKYLDLGYYSEKDGVPFTISSNLVLALQTALEHFISEEIFNEIIDLSSWLRHRLQKLGFQLVASESDMSPAVITIELPKKVNAKSIGQRLEKSGFLLSYKSEYLLKRNWIQICLMGKNSKESIIPLLNRLIVVIKK